MTTWLTADLHLGHANIVRYCDRPFDDVDHMDTAIVDNWNAVVGPDDDVYVIGDFTLGDVFQAEKYVRRLTGRRIYFVPGSHDQWMNVDLSRYPGDAWGRCEITQPIHQMKIRGVWTVLCHYAMRSWPRSYHGSVQLYGHSHCRLEADRLSRQMDVGVDCNGFTPVHESVVEGLARDPRPTVD